MKRISVVLPNYEHFNVTKAHVREVLFTSELRPYEIIVVNDGGDPSLRDTLKELVGPRKKRSTDVIYAYIKHPKIPWNYNGAVNLGVWLSVGDYLVIEDNDNIPQKTTYGQMLNVLMTYPKTGRVIAHKRMDIDSSQLEKPSTEWVSQRGRGPNQGSYMMRREVYTMLKGQDERMCGRYGWMYYDWRSRMLSQAKIDFAQAGYYWYVTDGQTSLKRGNHPQNYRVYRSNARSGEPHHEHGILNFKYTVEVL